MSGREWLQVNDVPYGADDDDGDTKRFLLRDAEYYQTLIRPIQDTVNIKFSRKLIF